MGRTGTISTPPKSELAQMNFTLELFLNLALPRAKYDLPIWPHQGVILEITDNLLKIVNSFGYLEVPWRLERHKDVGIRECYKGHKPVKVDLSLGRNRHSKLWIRLFNFMLWIFQSKILLWKGFLSKIRPSLASASQ